MAQSKEYREGWYAAESNWCNIGEIIRNPYERGWSYYEWRMGYDDFLYSLEDVE